MLGNDDGHPATLVCLGPQTESENAASIVIWHLGDASSILGSSLNHEKERKKRN